MEKQITQAQKRFVKGFQFYSVFYPKSKYTQLEDGVFTKPGYPNLLWVKSKTDFGLLMDAVIYDANGDKWADTQALYVAPPKVVEHNYALQVAKGNTVKFKAQDKELIGKIIKYPSNSAIVIQCVDAEYTINKTEIISIISK